ncbi:unnamed protein product [Malus baccata var. baccata]
MTFATISFEIALAYNLHETQRKVKRNGIVSDNKRESKTQKICTIPIWRKLDSYRRSLILMAEPIHLLEDNVALGALVKILDLCTVPDSDT